MVILLAAILAGSGVHRPHASALAEQTPVRLFDCHLAVAASEPDRRSGDPGCHRPPALDRSSGRGHAAFPAPRPVPIPLSAHLPQPVRRLSAVWSAILRRQRRQCGTSSMSLDEAREILGLAANPSRQEIIEAHRRLMQKVHPGPRRLHLPGAAAERGQAGAAQGCQLNRILTAFRSQPSKLPTGSRERHELLP